MRWDEPKRPEVGYTRIRRRFALFPIYVPEGRKNVWLEWVTVLEEFELTGVTEPRLRWRVVKEVA